MKTQDFLTNYWDGVVQAGDKVTYNQREIIEENYRMISGQYSNKYFADGTEKLYFRVIFGFAQALKRGSTLKLREFTMTSRNGKFIKFLNILKGAVIDFLDCNGWVEKRDEVLDDLVDMGHVLTKVVDGDTYVVDLRRFCFKPNMKSAKEEGGVELIDYTFEEAKAEFGESEHWGEIESHWEKIKDTETSLTILEHWTEDEFEVNGKKEFTKGCIKSLDRRGVKPDENISPGEWEAALELTRFVSPHEVPTTNRSEFKIYGKTKRVFPYDDEKLIKVRGRYIGMGVYELGRPCEEDINEKRNYKRKFDRMALRGILVHKVGNMRQDSDGEALTQEFLKKLDTGGALKIFSDESLERLNVGSTTGDTIAMVNDLFEFLRFLLGVTPTAIGQSTQNKTASFAVIQNQTQQDTYKIIKNRTARLFERIFQSFLIEDIIEDILSGETIVISADKKELEEMDKFLAKEEVDRVFGKTRPNIDKEVYDEVIEKRASQYSELKGSRYIGIENETVRKAFKKLIKEIKYLVKFNITDEAIDPNVKIKTLLDADQMQNEKLRDIILDIIGIDPRILQESDDEKRRRLEEQVMQEQAMTQARQPAPEIEQPILPNI